MKESVLDVLMYLFEHYLDEEADVEADRDSLERDLVQVGFPEVEVEKAFSWLEGLSEEHQPLIAKPGALPATRVFTTAEANRFGLECRSFLLFLEQVGVLDGETRERVIDRVMALGGEELDLDQLKWVVLMVLCNRSGTDSVHPWVEELVLDHAPGPLH